MVLPVGEFELMASGLYLEGLAVDHKRSAVWYSDVIGGGVHGIYQDGQSLHFNPDRIWTGGILLNEDGCVLSSGPGGIKWNNPDTNQSGWLITEIDGVAINAINEMIPDGTGGIYFGTNDIEMIAQGKNPRPTAIYRLTKEKRAIKLADGFNLTNGIMQCPIHKRFYCNDTFVGTYAFDVQPDFLLSNKSLFVDKTDVDGMALDATGCVWITGFRSGELTRIRPDGTALPSLSTPAQGITQIRFGGVDMRDIYINAIPRDGGDSLKEGKTLTQKASFLYRGRSDTPGMAIAPPRFRLAS